MRKNKQINKNPKQNKILTHISLYKINSKWIKDFNVKGRPIKLQGKKEKLSGI